MKKTYIKPEITFESFELATSIAAGCVLIGSNSEMYVCPVTDSESGLTFFSSDGCMTRPSDGDQSICYNVPLEGYGVFTS